MRIQSLPFAVAALSLFISVFPAPATAQNLLVNPDLSTNLSSWQLNLNTTFDPVQGSPSPGSARWVATVAAPFDFDDVQILDQCVDGIVPGATYAFGGRILVTTAPAGAVGGVGVIWKSIPCGGTAPAGCPCS
jgi:hypothetical protein